MTTTERLRALLAKEFGFDPAQLTPEARLEDLDIDSLRMIEIAFGIEEAFGITVAADPAELRAKLQTFGALAEYVDGLVRAGAPDTGVA